jgi:hypothetical protein
MRAVRARYKCASPDCAPKTGNEHLLFSAHTSID